MAEPMEAATETAPNGRLGQGTRLVDEALFAGDDPVSLRGAKCPQCATATFPAQRGCPRCGSQQMEVVTLPRAGLLWSFTVQNFRPKSPYRGSAEFEPYGVGYVDLGDVIVESRLVENRPERLVIGASLSLRLVPAFVDEDGTTVLTYAFGPEES